jgi:uncharacterized protein (DUF2235 family)
MKRIAIFCDGTWNRLSAEHPTNVVLAAQAVLPVAPDGVEQLTFYSEGVGTSFLVSRRVETALAGAFGLGLFDKIAEAYRFLSFNYRFGDEVYIFGFSRGAFTARSLAGLIRKCGIIPKARAGQIAAAFAFYKHAGTHPDSDEAQRFRMMNSPATLMKDEDRDWRLANACPVTTPESPLFSVRYVGVWDTVGALGVPQHLLLEMILRTARKYQFHDTALSSSVEAARHAIAIDEDRRSFAPAAWDNLDRLNALEGREGAYRQLWFPGNHGSVGGGGDVVGLSHEAFLWVAEGAAEKGLAFDGAKLALLREGVDHLAPLDNQSARGRLSRLFYLRAPRDGPQRADELADITLRRLRHKAEDWRPYRPPGLGRLLREFD